MTAHIQFLGTEGVFSSIVLQALLGAGCRVTKVWLAGTTASSVGPTATTATRLPQIPLENLSTLSGITRAWSIPLQGIASSEELWLLQRTEHAEPIDIILAACFPFRLPRELLTLPTYGCFNLHPSLLPAYRGPSPLFWQLRAGLAKGGVTLHLMAEQLDTGDIVAQESLPFPPGITAAEANQQLAKIGGRLAVGALDALQRGTLRRQPQPEHGASYFSWPKASDFHLCCHWSAERAFRFVRGTAGWGHRYQLVCGNRRFPIAEALGFSPHGTLDRAWEWRGAELWVQFRPGILRAAVVAERQEHSAGAAH